MTDLAPVAAEVPASIVEAQVVARMEAARQQLAEAKGITDAKRVADGAAAICEWLRRQAAVGLQIVNDGLLLKLEAEARMGQFLRQPGAVAERGRPEKTSEARTFKDLGVDRRRAAEYREVATVPTDTLRQLASAATAANKELTRESVLKVAKRIRIREGAANGNGNGHHPEPEPPAAVTLPADWLNRIVTGDARQLAADLPDESVALCLCDPVYQNTDDYRWLARECERILVPGGNLVVQCGNVHRYACEVAMRESALSFVDLIAEVYPYALCQLFPTRVMVGWKPWLWFSRGKRGGEWAMNRLAVGGKQHREESKDLHPWGDSEQFAAGVIGKLAGPASVVWDPFTGSGTVPAVCKRLGVPFVAFEIDADSAEAARDRVNGTRRDTSPQVDLDFSEVA